MAPSFLCECHINMSPRNLNLDAGQSACAALLMSQLFHADDGSHRDIYTGSKTISRSPIPPKKFDRNGSFRPEWTIGFCRVVTCHLNIRHAESNQRLMKCSESQDISSG